MKFIDQLKQEVRIHGDMETDFRTRRYQHAKAIAHKYVDSIEEEARIAARSGNYELLEQHAVISGFCEISETDFAKPIVSEVITKSHLSGKKHAQYTVNAENDLFEAFLSAYKQLCEEDGIQFFPFQAKILQKDGTILYHTFPFSLKNIKKEKIQACGFPYKIEF